MGDVTREVSDRIGKNGQLLRIYGVERATGLTLAPKYVAKDISRYKKIEPGMFAYNPMRLNIGSLGFCSGAHEPGAVSPDYVVFECLPSSLDPLFMHYLTESQQWDEWVRGAGVGSVRVRIYYRELARMPLQIPPIDEQRDIAAVLCSLDDKIEQNRRTGAKLEELARAVFKAWFVDFEPVKAKAAGATAFPGMPTETFAALPTIFSHSRLGPIPRGWEVGALSDIADVIMGTSPPSSTYNDTAFGHALINGPVEFGERFPLRVKWTTAPVKLADSGDLIFCVRGSTTGRRVLSDGVYGLGRGVCAIRCKRRAQAFVNHLIDFELPRLLSGTTGSVFPSLSAPSIKDFEIVQPSPYVISAFCDFAEPMLEAANAVAAESAKVATLRDYLLPRLLSGRVRVAGRIDPNF